MKKKNRDVDTRPSYDEGFDYERFAREELERERMMREDNLAREEEYWSQEKNTAPEFTSTEEKTDESSEFFDWIQCLVSALIFCVIVFTFFVRTIGVIGQSMEPTFHSGDRVVISDLFYKPKQGDVVVLRKQSFQKEPIIKRIIATENQKVSIDFNAGIVYVDDVPLDEPYIAEPTNEPLDFTGDIIVPENCVFVMGDNRNHSSDSRRATIGCVDERYIIGRVLLRVLPVSDFGVVD